MFNLKKESPIPPRSKEPSVWGLLGQLNENWYLDGGRASHEIVTQWYDFPDAEI